MSNRHKTQIGRTARKKAEASAARLFKRDQIALRNGGRLSYMYYHFALRRKTWTPFG